MAKEKPVCQYEGCGLVKTAAVHTGYGDDKHEFVPPDNPRFGDNRRPINPRSERRERYYAEVRRPEVAAAVGNGRRPCQIKAPGCTGYVESIHETATRGRFGGLEAASAAGLKFDCCNNCNRYCSEHPVWARERGFLKSNRGADRKPAGFNKWSVFSDDEEDE